MVNFTEQHKNTLKDLIFEAVTKNWQITGKLGANYTVADLFHICTLNTLRSLKKQLTSKINDLPEDEWVEKSQIATEQSEYLTNCLNLVNLIIGFRLWRAEQYSKEEKRTELMARIKELEESQKTPEEQLKELKAELESL